jgi:hypothetical protein
MIGKRVILLGTSYVDGGENTRRKRGETGTIVDVSTLNPKLGGNTQYWVKWHRTGLGISALIEGEDEFKILEEERKNYSITTTS